MTRKEEASAVGKHILLGGDCRARRGSNPFGVVAPCSITGKKGKRSNSPSSSGIEPSCSLQKQSSPLKDSSI